MTTYDEWRITGTPLRRSVEQTYSGEDFTDPEGAARWYMAAATGPAPWVDGPHLHRRTVTVTDWELAVASLGVDEDAPQCRERGIGDHDCAQHAPPSPLSAPVTAQEPPAVGQDRPDAHSGSQARTVECKLVRPAGPGPTDPCDCFVSQPCAMQHPREPERKADQAFPCECEGFRLSVPQPPGPDRCYCRHERADHDRHGTCTREAVMLG